MTFLNRNKKTNKGNTEIRKNNVPKVSVKNVFVCKTIIISSYCNDDDFSPSYVIWYFLAKRNEGKFYELFSGMKLEEENDNSKNEDFCCFDTPYIQKSEQIRKYLKNKATKEMDIQSLFQFITNMNVRNMLGAYDQDDED